MNLAQLIGEKTLRISDLEDQLSSRRSAGAARVPNPDKPPRSGSCAAAIEQLLESAGRSMLCGEIDRALKDFSGANVAMALTQLTARGRVKREGSPRHYRYSRQPVTA